MDAAITPLFFFAGFFFAGGALVLLLGLYRRLGKDQRPPAAGTTTRIENMMAGLEALREEIDGQKALVRDLSNALREDVEGHKAEVRNLFGNVEAKMSHIQQAVDTTSAKHEELGEAQRELAQTVADRAHDLDTIRQRMDELNKGVSGPAVPASQEQDEIVAEPVPSDVGGPKEESHPETPSAKPSVDQDRATFDIVGGVPDVQIFEVVETPPETPHNPEQTREAFRELLSIMSEPKFPDGDTPGAEQAPHPPAADQPPGSPNAGNASHTNAALCARVYERADAGMSVSEIARELGINKGEIRLMLSLRENKT